jgi:hypothetical protein
MKRQQKHKSKGVKKRSGTTRSATSLDDLQHMELSGPDDKKTSLNASSTDENEDEGLGDGNIGRSAGNVLDEE